MALIVGIAEEAELYEIDDTAVMEAVEGFLEPGGEGTPSVGEFLAHELGGILQISPDAALERIGTVLDLRFRFPALWEAFLSGSLRWWQVAEVVNRPSVSQLNAQAASRLDRKLAIALRMWPWKRIRRHLEASIIAADPALNPDSDCSGVAEVERWERCESLTWAMAAQRTVPEYLIAAGDGDSCRGRALLSFPCNDA